MTHSAIQQKSWDRFAVGPNPRVNALFTLRGAPSADPQHPPCYGGMNLGLHVGDDAHTVRQKRRALAAQTATQPTYMKQIHGKDVVRLHAHAQDQTQSLQDEVQADGAFTTDPGVACVVLVADCLPVLMADEQGRFVAAAHAGWRGLAAGVIEATLEAACAAARVPTSSVHAWLGPCIGPTAFEVGRDVLEVFESSPFSLDSGFMNEVFRPRPGSSQSQSAALHPDGKPRWLVDLPHLAELRLRSLGLKCIVVHGGCTVSDPARFFSYRRDGVTGRHAAMIWLQKPAALKD